MNMYAKLSAIGENESPLYSTILAEISFFRTKFLDQITFPLFLENP